MKIGVAAPVFSDDARRAVDFAKTAEVLGYDGVFVFDHLHPLQQPERKALAWLPVLSAIGEATTTLTIAPLVARTGITPNRLLSQQIATMYHLFESRFIAALGVGDHLAKVEYESYGVEYKAFEQRLVDSEEVCQQLKEQSVPLWVSARSDVIQNRLLAYLDGINVWQAPAEEVQALKNAHPKLQISWGGVYEEIEGDTEKFLSTLDGDGCDWAIVYFAKDPERQLEKLASLAKDLSH